MWKETVAILERGRIEDPNKAVFPLLLQPASQDQNRDNRHAMAFHFAMWLCSKPELHDFRIASDTETLDNPISDRRGYGIWVLFGKRADRTAFTKWLAKYKLWFTERPIHDTFLPDFPSSGCVRISVVNTPFARQDFMSENYPDGFSERWAWVIEHCKSPVYLMPTRGLAFTSEKEGMHFKLRWC